MLPIFLGNYFIASLFSYAALPDNTVPPGTFDLAFGVLAGAFFLINFWVYQRSIVSNGLSLSVGVMRIAMIIPILMAVAVFGESLKVWGIMGIILGLAAFALKAEPKNLHNFYWIIALFLISGATDASLKIYKELGSSSEQLFVYLVFSSAFVLTLFAIIIGRIRFGYKSIAFGLILGLPNRLSTVFFLKGLDSVPAALAYPVVAVSIVLLSIASDILIWKKKAGGKEILLWILLVCALVLLNIK